MSQQLTLADAQSSLTTHIAGKAAEIRAKYGPAIGWRELNLILEDRDCTRYPCEIVFDDKPLRDGEFAHPIARSENPEDGYRMHVHPFFSTQPGQIPALVLYQLVLVNYGDFASPTDAEIFGATVLGLGQEEYYAQLCELADLVSAGIATADPAVAEASHGCGCGSGGCGSAGGATAHADPAGTSHGCGCGGGGCGSH
jgi:hypothetical protein